MELWKKCVSAHFFLCFLYKKHKNSEKKAQKYTKMQAICIFFAFFLHIRKICCNFAVQMCVRVYTYARETEKSRK